MRSTTSTSYDSLLASTRPRGVLGVVDDVTALESLRQVARRLAIVLDQ
jgi:hypothetical protein